MTDIDVLRITPFGEITDEVINTDRDRSTLHGLYRLIGCGHVDVVNLGQFDMWVDDEAALTGALINPLATWVAVRLGAPQQLYLGAAVFAAVDTDGATTSLTDDHRAVIHQALSEIMTGDPWC